MSGPSAASDARATLGVVVIVGFVVLVMVFGPDLLRWFIGTAFYVTDLLNDFPSTATVPFPDHPGANQ